jgi:hypothetical protein
MEALEPRAKEFLCRFDARMSANEQQPAHQRRQVQLIGECPYVGLIGFSGKNPTGLEASASERCGHAVKLLGPPRGNKHHVVA